MRISLRQLWAPEDHRLPRHQGPPDMGRRASSSLSGLDVEGEDVEGGTAGDDDFVYEDATAADADAASSERTRRR